MDMNTSSALDGLASNGILNFDADSYLKGTAPRYTGNPSMGSYLPGDAPFLNPFSPYGINPGAHLAGQPRSDAFIFHKAKKATNNSFVIPFKSATTGVIAGALALFGYSKIKGAVKGGTGGLKGVWTSIKSGFGKLINGSQGATATTEAAKKTTGLGAKLKGLVSKLPGGVKAVAIIGIGLLGANAIYNKITGHTAAENPQQPMM